MLGGFHFFAGSALSLSFTRNVYIAFLIGFVSHHFLDRLPHLDTNIFKNSKYESIKNWDLKVWLLVISEFLFFLFLTFSFLKKLSFDLQKIALLGGIGGIFPDAFSLLLKSFLPSVRIFDFYLNFHKNFHFKLENKNYLLPVLVELILFLFVILLLMGVNINY